MENKKPLRNTEILRRLVKIKEMVSRLNGLDKEKIVHEIQYLIDNI